MGNLASSSTPDDTGADKLEALSFFRTLDIDIVRSIVKEWKSVAKELVPWKLYFTTMVKYEEELKYGKEVFVRKYWNPACMNYAMRKEAINLNDDRTEEVANTSINVSEGHTTNQNDAFTDDYSSNEGSGIAENEKSNDVNEEFSNVPVVSSLSATIHPSFIGYQTVTIKQYEQIKQREGIERKKREQRAMEKAISVRTNMINKQEEQFRSQKQSRENKIQQLKKSYESEKVKRKGEYDKEIIGLQDSLAATLKDKFMKQEMLFEMAFSREFQELSEKNDAKNLLDVKVLSQKREELTALMNAQNHENPIGSMLEVFCRDEIKRCTESLSKGMNNTQKLAAELRALKNEIEAMTDSNDPKVTKSKQYQELRSMINIAETRLKEALKELDAINLEVEDAEALLLKASSLKILEEALLPLFSAINPDFARLEGCSTTTVCVSLVLLAQGSFDTKCNELYNIVDDKNSGLFDLQFVMKLGGLLFESLQCLSIIPKSLRKVEMENSIIRGFLNFSVNFRSDHISEYELKLLIAIIISQNSKLMECLGYVHPLKQSSNAKYKNTMISNYQLSNMSSLAAVFQGFIAPSNAIRAIHFELQRFKPNLLEIKRRNLHDRAFAMGSVDPLRTDYSKFFAKKEKKSSYYVKPLDNGMYTNSEYYSEAARIRSIIKIQSFVRTILNKKLAEKESRRLAYMEAKVAVVKQLKNRILKEFQQREASKGMGKMKWDAEIRMKQAKLRADGQVVSRTETVMIMVEEAIASAKQQIDERFRQFEPKTSTNLNNNSTLSESPTSNSIVAFGLPTRFAPQIRRESVLPEDSTDEDNLLMKDIDSKESTEDNVASNFLEYIENPTYLLKLFPTLVDKNMHYNSNYTGDVVFLTIFRLVLMQPEVETYQHLFNRLNLMHKVFTVFKVREILGEFPSKRLLVKYIRSKSDELLREDLKSHFKFKKFADIVAKELRELSNADLEYGVLTKVLNNTCQKVFAFFINIFEKEFSKIADEKLKANQALKNDQFSVSKVIASELNILQNRSMQLTSSLDSVVVRLHQDQLDLNQIRFSIDRVDNEIASFQMKMLSLNDNEFHQVSRIIPLTWRYDWNRRFYDAKNLASTMSKDALLEMENVVNEFLFTVGNCSVTIIHELFLPEHMKTVKIVSRKGVDGRGIHSGRGLSNGERYYFESHNIYFTILLDYDGIFNGSDEYAAKSGNQELLASQIVLNAEVPLLFPPLTATIDYFGYRVLATAKLPIVHASFGDDGLLQSTHTDQVHGMLNKGETYLNKNRKASGLVKMLATKLNIKEHKCKGTLDPSPSSTFSAMLKVYRGVDESFYVRNCKSLMPSELHMATPHLTTVPRLQSIFWRFIRPELIELNSVTLSPDCGTVITMGLDDDSGNREDLVHTTNSMLSKIPIFIKRLLSKNLQLPTSINQELILSQDFHKEGINLRHMGLVRSMLWRLLPGKCSIYHNESFLRTTEDLREELKNGEKIYINGELFTIKEINKIKISHNRVPLNRVYSGDSVHRVETYCGGIDEDKGNNTLSLILLAEMVARSMKNLIRFQLREFSSINRSCSLTISQQLLVDSFNLITGASLNSANYFAEVIYSAVRERFGNCSIRPSERKHFSFILRPAITYLVGRLQSMMGVQLHPYCVNEFEQNPFGFTFSPGDIQQLKPIVKHNFSDWYYIQAVNLAQLADEVREKDYHFSVMRDQPLVFFTFSERRGSKSASNHGTLGHLYDAVVSDGCILEQSGPIKSNPFIRSVGFRPISTPMIDIKHHISLVPQSTTMHFSIEMFVRNSSNCDFNKTLITSGRFQISISRDGYLVVSLYQECHTIALTLVKVDENKWFHVIMAYDGTSLRVYLNYSLISEVETKPLFDLRLHAFEQEHLAKIQGLKRDEESEKEALKGKVNSEANVFFQTKEGVSTLKRMSQVILDTEDPDIEMPDNGNGDRLNKARELKANALKKAKERYTSDLYESKIREVGSRYKQILLDLEEQKSAYLREGKLKSFNPIRIGASLPDANNRTGSSYFHGEISCVSIYGKCLSQDEVRMHFLSSLRDSRKDANRLHSLVADKFMHAMRQGGVKQRHTKFLNIYARSLCNLLYFEPKERDIVDTSHILSHLLVLLEKFKNQKELEPVMQIIKHLPRDQEFSIVIVKAISVVRAVDKTFFSRTASISRKDIVNIPFEYSLVSPERSSDYFETASFIFQEVVKDIDLMFIYGDVDLRWISQLSSPKLVIALVKSAMEDKHLRVIKIAEVFSAQYASNDLLCDDDVQILSQYLPLTEGLDFKYCSSISDSAVDSIIRLGNIRVLVLDSCSKITDKAMTNVKIIANRLELFSIQDLPLVTDDGLLAIADKCQNLKHLNLNRCSGISFATVERFVRGKPNLGVLGLSGLRLSDGELVKVAALLATCNLVSLDISHCYEVSDFGAIALAESCSALKLLNVSGNSKISADGLRTICCRCWNLEMVSMNDLFLITDEIFAYSPKFDGRAAANERMLTELNTLILEGCDMLTDTAILNISERCRKFLKLSLRGLKRLTDKSLTFLSNNLLCPYSVQPLCLTLKSLDLSYVSQLTPAALLEAFTYCKNLDTLFLEGMIKVVDDDFLKKLAQLCPSLQHLFVAKCINISDCGICNIAEVLWLENLDIRGCSKVTSSAIEVLAECCTGLHSLKLTKTKKITNDVLDFARKNCRQLKLEVEEKMK